MALYRSDLVRDPLASATLSAGVPKLDDTNALRTTLSKQRKPLKQRAELRARVTSPIA